MGAETPNILLIIALTEDGQFANGIWSLPTSERYFTWYIHISATSMKKKKPSTGNPRWVKRTGHEWFKILQKILHLNNVLEAKTHMPPLIETHSRHSCRGPTRDWPKVDLDSQKIELDKRGRPSKIRDGEKGQSNTHSKSLDKNHSPNFPPKCRRA